MSSPAVEEMPSYVPRHRLTHPVLVSPFKGRWLAWCGNCGWSQDVPSWEAGLRAAKKNHCD